VAIERLALGAHQALARCRRVSSTARVETGAKHAVAAIAS
jgi:hypothetical protein